MKGHTVSVIETGTLMPTGTYEHPSTNIKVGQERASVTGLVSIVVMSPSLLEV